MNESTIRVIATVLGGMLLAAVMFLFNGVQNAGNRLISVESTIAALQSEIVGTRKDTTETRRVVVNRMIDTERETVKRASIFCVKLNRVLEPTERLDCSALEY